MGGGIAYFKTIRLCSIIAALSNTITVVVWDFAPAWWLRFSGAGPSKWALQVPVRASCGQFAGAAA
jgi:hypothetical protein